MRWLALGVVVAAATRATAAPDPMPPEAPATGSAAAGTASSAEAGSASSPARSGDGAPLTDDPVLGRASRVNGHELHGVVAFTFDDGPNPETTPAIIDALERYNVPATFFIVTRHFLGKDAEKSRELLHREVADGFVIGSHSVTHHNLKHAAGAQLTKEIDDSVRTLSREAARPIGLFRPPYGALSGAGRGRLKKLGVTEVVWSVDTRDWKAKNPDVLRKQVLSMILKKDGGVVLMHDVKPITAKVIGEVLDDLEAENCRRLDDKQDPIIPVSLHYFLRDGATSRAVPAYVQQRTEAYRVALPGRCANRVARASDGTKTIAAGAPAGDAAAKTAQQRLKDLQEKRAGHARTSSSAGDLGPAEQKPRRTRRLSRECRHHPRAPGCR